MFEQMHIKNFQIHTDLVVVFSEDITTIVGDTDHGKSSVMRALRWVCTNKPTGEDFITWGADTCEVTLWVDGHSITRRRGKGSNTYQIDDGPLLAGFGLEVPKEVQSILGLDAGGLNWQRQADQWLWVQEKSATVISEINRLVDMSIVDVAVGRCSAAHRAALAKANVLTEQQKSAKEAYEKSRLVIGKQEAWATVCRHYDDATQAEVTANDLFRRIEQAKVYETRKRAAVAQGKQGKALLGLGDVWRNAHAQTANLAALVAKAAHYKTRMGQGTPPVVPVLLKNTFQEWQVCHEKATQMKALVGRATEQRDRGDLAKANVKAAEAKLNSIKVCPTCNRPI